MKRNVNEISIEELLASLDGEDLSKENIEFTFDNPILSFVQAFDLKAGKQLICDKTLYALFKVWYKKTFFNQRSFNLQLERYLPSVMKTRRHFLIGTKILDIAQKIQEMQAKRPGNRVKSVTWNKHFEAFLTDTGLKPGTVFVEADILYYVYNRWCDDTRKKAWLGYENFIGICNLNFETKRISRNTLSWFGVNSKIKDLINKEEVDRWRVSRKNNGKKKENSSAEPYPLYKKEVLYFPKKEVKKKSK